jgi:FtsZ-binding cell division protein ZapB
MLRREIMELKDKSKVLDTSLKTVMKEKDKLVESVFELNETITSAQDRIKVQGGYENVLAEKAHVIKTCLEEIDNLKLLLQQQSETQKIKEEEHNAQIQKLREENLKLKVAVDELETIRDSI